MDDQMLIIRRALQATASGPLLGGERKGLHLKWSWDLSFDLSFDAIGSF